MDRGAVLRLAITLLLAPFFVRQHLRTAPLFLAWTVAEGLLLLSIFRWHIFPACYVESAEPNPLTLFKRASEVIIGLMFLGAILLVYRQRRHFEPKGLRLVIGAVAFGLAAEIPFILYARPDDWLNFSGHLLLVASFACIFAALVKANLKKVHDLMEGEGSALPSSHAPGRLSHDPWIALSLQTISRICGVVVIVTGAMVLVGWARDIERLKSILSSGVAMKPNAAVCLVLAGLALWLLQVARPATVRHRLARLLAMAVTLMAGLTLLEHLSGWNLGIDQALFQERPGAPGTASPGRMGPLTAFCLVLLGTSLGLVDAAKPAPPVCRTTPGSGSWSHCHAASDRLRLWSGRASMRGRI